MVGEDVLTIRRVWEGWDLLRADDRFWLAEEPPGLEHEWRALTSDLASGQQLDTDTYLAALALAGGYTFLTFDRGFRRYQALDALILSPSR